MTHSNNPIDVNKHLLVRIGASHQQINHLASRPFAALPLWARKRIKALRTEESLEHHKNHEARVKESTLVLADELVKALMPRSYSEPGEPSVISSTKPSTNERAEV